MAETQSKKSNEMIQIDVKSILESKLPSLKGKIPSFIISYLRKIIHEDEINDIFRYHGHLNGMDFANYLLDEHFKIKVNINGLENLPTSGKFIFVSNHPIGSMDGIALLRIIGQKYGQLKMPVNDILMHIENFKEYFIPVNKVQGNGQCRNISAILNEACQSDAAIVFFPSGQCSRKQSDGTICDNEWKKTFITKAKEYQRDVVPIHFEGRLSNFFYNLSYYRMKLGIKANIEMLYLADEFFQQKNKTYTITIGQPISYSVFDDSKTDKMWAQEVKKISYSLTSNDK